MNKRIFWNIIWVGLSLILAWGLNNITRELSNFDNGFIAFLTFASLILIFGTFIYTTNKKELRRNRELIIRFVLSGILIIIALAVEGFAGDIKADGRIMPFFSFNILSIPGQIISNIGSFLNIWGLALFFYSCFELIVYLKDKEYINFDRKMTHLFFVIMIIFYFIILFISISTYQTPQLLIKNDNSTGETILKISGKPWFVLINLSGYEDLTPIFLKSDQFYYKYKNSIETAAFADKTTTAKTAEECRDLFYQGVKNSEIVSLSCANLTKEEQCGKALLVFEYSVDNSTTKVTHYYDYYDGYCFDFYVSSDKKEESQAENMLRSIILID